MKRFDGLDAKYKTIDILERISSIIFWFSAVLTILLNASPDGHLPNCLQWVLFIIVLIYTILSQFNSLILIPQVEKARRRQLLTDSIGVPISLYETVGYYNNSIEPSVFRLGVSVFENSFFGKNICEQMLVSTRLKTLTFFLIWVTSIYYSENIETIMYITETIFISAIALAWVKLEILKNQLEQVFESLRTIFVHTDKSCDQKCVAGILDCFANYEAAKAKAGIKQSSTIFLKNNERLSVEWNEILNKLKLNGP